ncbi:tRNA (N6-isopentenyl adenosine(37)-C2)-methylthiotransferase MiaB [candidate division FCPU426 bacterium]|nr:tRNA (N6-isopentenyl adenosine(37)-C2)-methylthiotransferase MiaB [candidate division FCPU426 bacterium]
MKTYFIHTFGCQMNEYDTGRLEQILQAGGWVPAVSSSQADLLLANTCTVRQLAEDKAFSLLGRWAKMKKDRPGLIIGMVGCLAQHVGSKAYLRAPWLDFLAGPQALKRVPELAEKARRHKRNHDFSVYDDGPEDTASSKQASSAYVAVMDGCDQFCTYCAVPQARGREKSRGPEAIIEEIRRRAQAGTKEITLLGQNITRYGWDAAGAMHLAELIRRIAAEVPAIRRLRFLTGHPGAFTNELIQTMAEVPVVCKALHLPLQSGSDAVLQAMHRGYTSAEYRGLVARLKKAIPGLVLTTDIIVGFPGETDADFTSTLDMIAACDFDLAFCFKYSPRQGTEAAAWPHQIPQPEKEKRLAACMRLVEEKAIGRRVKWVGRKVSVLVEGPDPKTGRRLQGRTPENFIVNFEGPQTWIGEEVEVEITAAGNWAFMGDAENTAAGAPFLRA